MAERSSYRVLFAQRAAKDVKTLTPKLKAKLTDIIWNHIAVDPKSGKRLVGDLAGYWSVRLTIKDRIVYRIDEQQHTVYVLRARTHYSL